MRPVHTGPARGPLADAAGADLREWLTVRGYSPGTIPQVVNVALWLSAWMDDHAVKASRRVVGFEVGSSVLTGRW
jgi:hypothetical protein